MTKSVYRLQLHFSFLLLGQLFLIVDNTAFAADVGAGEEIYNQLCLSCHGPTALGIDALGSPALAGQHQAYLVRQLANFSQGLRGMAKSDRYGQQMAAMATLVNDAASRKNVSAYLASLDKPTTSINNSKTNTGNDQGYKIYQASCGACHGADASGNARLNTPSLVGLSAPYLSRQFANFLSGARGSDKSDKLGRQMKMIAATLTEQAKIDAAIAYIVSLKD